MGRREGEGSGCVLERVGGGRDRLGPHQLLGQVLLDGRVGATCSVHSSRMKGWDGEGGSDNGRLRPLPTVC
jgi:hypothetical protein